MPVILYRIVRQILNDLVFPTKVLSHRADLEKAQNEERKEMLGLWIAVAASPQPR